MDNKITLEKSKKFDQVFGKEVKESGNFNSNLKPPKPEEIDLEMFGKITTDIEECFRLSIEKIEKQFREQTHEIKSVFYDKV